MAIWRDSGRGSVGFFEPALAPRYFAVVGLALVAVNVFTFLYHLFGSAVFNAIGNAVSIGLILYSVHVLLQSPSRGGADRTFPVLAGSLAALSVLANLAVASPIVTLKYLSIYIFYAAGYACSGQLRSVEIRCMYLLAALPVVFMALGSSKNYGSEAIAYLPNANTAVLYFSALLFALTTRYGKAVIFLQFVNATLMNKVGAAVATAAAIGLWAIFPLRRASVIVIAALAGGCVAAHMLGAFDRVLTAYGNVLLIADLEPARVASMSYKDLVELTGTTDLSAFFRIIHWTNIWNLYSSFGIGTLLFGYGAGQTEYLAYAPLPPHNDYLRILAEYGALNFAVFAAFLLYVTIAIRSVVGRVLFIVLLTYFFTENLLDNFTSMAIYFAYAGRMAAASLPLRGGAVIGAGAWTARAG